MKLKTKLSGDIIGLDLGASRTGLARLAINVGIAESLPAINMKEGNFLISLQKIINEFEAEALVVGLPRSLNGEITTQTELVIKSVEKLKQEFSLPIFTIDEAGTTKQAELIALKGQDVDSVAAAIIVEDFFSELKRGKIENVTI